MLANEQVLPDGTCERSGDLVERRLLEQWFLRITKYADDLLSALDWLDWPERVKTMQRNWIGRSEGARLRFVVDGHDELAIEVFTTCPDTGFGATFLALVPEHPLVDELATPDNAEQVEHRPRVASTETDVRRMADDAAQKRGAPTGSFAINPFNGERIPIYVAEYVISTYGTGAIMAVPGEDERELRVRDDPRPSRHPHRRAAERFRGRRLDRYRGKGQQRLHGRTRHRTGERSRRRMARRPGRR